MQRFMVGYSGLYKNVKEGDILSQHNVCSDLGGYVLFYPRGLQLFLLSWHHDVVSAAE